MERPTTHNAGTIGFYVAVYAKPEADLYMTQLEQALKRAETENNKLRKIINAKR